MEYEILFKIGVSKEVIRINKDNYETEILKCKSRAKFKLLLVRISTFDVMILALQRTLVYFRGSLLNGITLLIIIKMMTLMTVINLNYQNIWTMR